MEVAMWLGGVADSSVRISAMVRPLPPPGRSTDDTSKSGTSRRSSCARRCNLRYSAADARIVSVDCQFFMRPRKPAVLYESRQVESRTRGCCKMSTVQPLQELSEPVNQFPDTYAVFRLEHVLFRVSEFLV